MFYFSTICNDCKVFHLITSWLLTNFQLLNVPTATSVFHLVWHDDTNHNFGCASFLRMNWEGRRCPGCGTEGPDVHHPCRKLCFLNHRWHHALKRASGVTSSHLIHSAATFHSNLIWSLWSLVIIVLNFHMLIRHLFSLFCLLAFFSWGFNSCFITTL